jgi:hypothetical protein
MLGYFGQTRRFLIFIVYLVFPASRRPRSREEWPRMYTNAEKFRYDTARIVIMKLLIKHQMVKQETCERTFALHDAQQHV